MEYISREYSYYIHQHNELLVISTLQVIEELQSSIKKLVSKQ